MIQGIMFRLGLAIPLAIGIYVLANAVSHPMEFWVAYLLGLGVVVVGVEVLDIVLDGLS